MKALSLLITVLGLSLPTLADTVKLICKSEASSALTFVATVADNNAVQMTFGPNGENPTDEQMINKKTDLKFTETLNDFAHYTGQAIVELAYIRDLELSIPREALRNRAPTVHLTLSISNEHAKYGQMSYFVQYGMLCTKRVYVY